MNNVKIGSPLYILREKCAKDLMGVLEKLAEIGYEGIEFLGFFGNTPLSIKKKLDSCGLKAVGNHVSYDEFIQNSEKVIEEHKILGCGYITIGAPAADGLPGGKGYSKSVAEIEKLGKMMNAADMRLLFHNHADELKTYAEDKKTVLEGFLDGIKPNLLYFEPDLGWIQIGGAEPLYYLEKYKGRCPVIHFKDYCPDRFCGKKHENGFEFRPTGYGIMNNAALYALSLECNPEWYIMDHDCSYERDEFSDLRLSLEYFKNLRRHLPC